MIRTIIAAAFAAALVTLPAAAEDSTAPNPAELIGSWTVDLRPSPDAPPAPAPMVITAAGEDGLEATFYGSPVAEGRVNTLWGAVHFAFVTEDGSGPYATSGVLLPDGTIAGRSHSLGRDFLAVWTATRDEDSAE